MLYGNVNFGPVSVTLLMFYYVMAFNFPTRPSVKVDPSCFMFGCCSSYHGDYCSYGAIYIGMLAYWSMGLSG